MGRNLRVGARPLVGAALMAVLCIGAVTPAHASAPSIQPTGAAVSIGATVLPGIRVTFSAGAGVAVRTNTRFQLTQGVGANGSTYTVVQE